MLNLSLKEKMKKILALASAAGITLVTTGCFSDYEKQNDDVAMQPVGYSSDVDSTTPKKEDSTSDFDPNTVTRLVIPEETALRVVITDKKDETTTTASEAIDEVTTTSKDEEYTPTTSVTLAKRENRSTVTTATKATTKSVTKPTTKVTLKTTKATKPTTRATTTTTTTAAPVTEPPVTEPEPVIIEPELPPVGDGSVQDILWNFSAYYSFSQDFLNEIVCASNYAGTNTYVEYDYGYGSSTLGSECFMLLYNLNVGSGYEFDKNMVKNFYKKYSNESLMQFKQFNFKTNEVAQCYSGRVNDWKRYTIDPSVGDFLNAARDAYESNQIDSFMEDKIVNNNIDPKILYNSAAMAILYDYADGRYISEELRSQIDEGLNSNINDIIDVVNSKSMIM